jgi:hypothetical protein
VISENNGKIKEISKELKKERSVKEAVEKKMKDLDQKSKQDFYAFKTEHITKTNTEIKEKQASLDEQSSIREELEVKIKELMSSKIALEVKTKSANKKLENSLKQ